VLFSSGVSLKEIELVDILGFLSICPSSLP
jgi:hypothetical protein